MMIPAGLREVGVGKTRFQLVVTHQRVFRRQRLRTRPQNLHARVNSGRPYIQLQCYKLLVTVESVLAFGHVIAADPRFAWRAYNEGLWRSPKWGPGAEHLLGSAESFLSIFIQERRQI